MDDKAFKKFLKSFGNMKRNPSKFPVVEWSNRPFVKMPLRGLKPSTFIIDHETWTNCINDPHLTLPPTAPEDFPDLLDYCREKGLDVRDYQPHPGMCSWILHDLKPQYFTKVIVPELKRRAKKWNRRITYRFKTACRQPRRVHVHLQLWLKIKRPEVVHYPGR